MEAIRRCAYVRHPMSLTHLFREGSAFSMCGKFLTLEYRVRPDSAKVTCEQCLAALIEQEQVLEGAMA